MNEELITSIQKEQSSCSLLPGFGEAPPTFTLPPSYPELLGPLADAMIEHYARNGNDGIDFVNTVIDPGLTPNGARRLFEEFAFLDDQLNGQNSCDALPSFLKQITHEPTYEYNGFHCDSLEEYSRAYLKLAVRPRVGTIGAQLGTEGKILTTGPNRFNPRPLAIENGDGEVEYIQLGSIFYWDSEPSVEELLEMGEYDDILSVLDTYAGFTEQLGGMIPNWNNSSCGRTQKPLFFRMVEKTAEKLESVESGARDEVLIRFLRPMILHYNFLRDGMDDSTKLKEKPGSTYRRVGRLPDGEAALHGFDDRHDHAKPGNELRNCRPRPEMDKHDRHELAKYQTLIGRELTEEERCDFFLGFFVGAESSLDFTHDQRDEDGRLIGQRLIDPALNALYAQGGLVIAEAWRALGRKYPELAERAELEALKYEAEFDRIQQILFKYAYRPEDKMFGMYDFVKAAQENNADAGHRKAWSLNGVFVLTALNLDTMLASEILDNIDNEYLRPDGLLAASRYFESDDQWDGKASWPILVRESIKAAIKYGRLDLAEKWLTIHIESHELHFAAEGKSAEKFDSSTRGKALVIGEYGKVNDLTMTHAVYLWMLAALKTVRKLKASKAAGMAAIQV